MKETWKISRTSRQGHTLTTEKTDRTGCRSKEITTKFCMKSELYSRKTEKISRTDRAKEKLQEEGRNRSHPTTGINRTSFRKVKSIKRTKRGKFKKDWK